MGLDIHAASHLRFVRAFPEWEELDRIETEVFQQGKCIDEVYFLLRANDEVWEEHLEGTEPGLYEYTDQSEQLQFRVGGYSDYHRWREQLCQCVHGVEPEYLWDHLERFRDQPFFELIDFTDCDARIGTLVASELALDFRSHMDKANTFAVSLGDSSFLEHYSNFCKAFELASQSGALAFC